MEKLASLGYVRIRSVHKLLEAFACVVCVLSRATILIDMSMVVEEPYNVLVAIGNMEFLCPKPWEIPTG